MDLESVPEALQERLGTEATVGLLHVVDAAGREWKAAVMESAADRFERRLVEETARLRVQIGESEGRVREQISSLEVRLKRRISDSLKWSFVFWIGQVFAMTAIMTAIMNVMLRGR